MFRQNAFLSTALVTMLIATPALAMSPMGEITGEIGEEAFLWETLDVLEEGTGDGGIRGVRAGDVGHHPGT